MNIHSLLQLLVIIEECKLAKNVVGELELVLRSYKFDFYGVLKQPRPNVDLANFILAGRWPDKWPLTYMNKRYMLVDPVARYLGRAQRPFRWRDAMIAQKGDPLRRRMEQMMAEIWQSVLAVDRVAADDNFFELGGHSLLSLRVAQAVEQRTGYRMDARVLFFHTLRQVAALVGPDAERADTHGR